MPDPDERLLIVDDDELVRRMCAEALHRQGYEVVTVGTGQEALQHLAEQPFALVVLDIVLPDIDGLTILKTLRQTNPEIVVLLITGYASLETAIEALRQGAYEYLRKPFAPADLARIVRQGLDQRHRVLNDRQQLAEFTSINQDLLRRVDLATEELSAFIQLGRQFRESTDTQAMLERVGQAARQLSGATVSGLFRCDEDRCVCLSAGGVRAETLRALELSSDPLLQEALRTGRPAVCPQLLRDPAAATGPLALAGFTAALIVPLLAAADAVGALVLLDPRRDFTERQATLVQVIAAQAAEMLAHLPAPPPSAAAPDDFVDLQQLLDRDA
jgi:ActR/RegA family two-component response regulator